MNENENETYSDALELAFDAIKIAEDKSAPGISKTDAQTMAALWINLAIAVELRQAKGILSAIDGETARIADALETANEIAVTASGPGKTMTAVELIARGFGQGVGLNTPNPDAAAEKPRELVRKYPELFDVPLPRPSGGVL